MMYLQIVAALERVKKRKRARKAHNENCKRIQSNIIMVKKAGAEVEDEDLSRLVLVYFLQHEIYLILAYSLALFFCFM
jgi:hypothetical protein